jgi:hypothetical protein
VSDEYSNPPPDSPASPGAVAAKCHGADCEVIPPRADAVAFVIRNGIGATVDTCSDFLDALDRLRTSPTADAVFDAREVKLAYKPERRRHRAYAGAA